MPVTAGKRGSARAIALPVRRRGFDLRALRPSLKSVAVGIGLVLLAAGAYAGALETSVFAVRQMKIVGGSALTKAEVQAALQPELGKSLLRVTGPDVQRRLADVPTVLSVQIDREFPHTLRVRIRPERPVLLLRQGASGWVVSARGRVLSQVKNVLLSSLPRTYVPHNVAVAVGGTLGAQGGGLAAQALAPLVGTRLLSHVRFVTASEKELTLDLRSGVEVRLGDPGDLRLKFAIARRILGMIGSTTTHGYIDVSVPERPVLGQ